MARELIRPASPCRFVQMDASMLALQDRSFDMVVCVQNGICAFVIDPGRLLAEALRVTRSGGTILMSSYAPAFWPERLTWFESQAAAGLVGAIDYERTKEGTIVCRDGFKAGTFGADEFHALCRRHEIEPVVTTVDDSSVFCEISVPGATPPQASR